MLIGTLFETIAPLKPQLRERQLHLLHSAVDLTSTREWSETYRPRPHDPPAFGVFFETRDLSDRETGMREVVVTILISCSRPVCSTRTSDLGMTPLGRSLIPVWPVAQNGTGLTNINGLFLRL